MPTADIVGAVGKTNKNCQTPTLTHLNRKQLGLRLDAIVIRNTYGSSGPGRGKYWTNVTFRWKVRGCYGQRKAKIHTLSSLFLAFGVSRIRVTGFRQNLGSFFKTFEIQLFVASLLS